MVFQWAQSKTNFPIFRVNFRYLNFRGALILETLITWNVNFGDVNYLDLYFSYILLEGAGGCIEEVYHVCHCLDN